MPIFRFSMNAISQEMKRKVFEFSLAVYRVTDLFPMGEALKRQTREIANELLREISELEAKESFDVVAVKRIIGKMLVLKNFLLLAKYNSFVRPVNVDVLLKELSFFESFFMRQLQYQNGSFENETKESEKKEESFKAVFKQDVKSVFTDAGGIAEQKSAEREEKPIGNNNNGGSERQRAILDYLRAKKTAKANDLAIIFSNRFSLKTLQRDLALLIENKTVEKKGDKRWATYMIRERETAPFA